MQVHEREHTKTSQSEGTDGFLIKEILAGNQQSFEILVRRYHGPLFSFIRHYLGDYDLASDISQNVFLQLYISLPTLRTNEPVRAWLYQVARNRCLDELRRKRAIPFSQIEAVEEEEELSPLTILPDTDPLPEEMAERKELKQLLHEAINGLPPKYRAVVLLRYTGQLTFAEISKTLNMPEATTKTYFQRARPLLRAALSSLRPQSVQAS